MRTNGLRRLLASVAAGALVTAATTALPAPALALPAPAAEVAEPAAAGAGAAEAAAVTPAAVTAPAPAAVPQGPVTGSGCTVAAGAAICDLYAKPGTLTVSSTAIPIWGLATTAAAPATTPGPVLVVPQGTTVSLTIHNGLAGALGLAVPGLLTGPDDRTGAAAGAAKTYTFTASRPGTFLYEAGHTPDGARQTAMGVFGALVVRPAAPATAYGTAASGFDDEAVLVLSEVDPAFNADPLNYDLRAFRPAYRLVNGKAYPETDPVATAPGRRALLRYVNAGVVAHAMGVTGTEETVLATDARPAENPRPHVSDTINAGSTEDMLVTVPGPEDGAKFALYETAGRLDTAGHRVGTTNTVAFGGMMTFLDTGATPSTTDIAGPVTSNLSGTPAAATALQTVTVRADFSDAANGGSNVTRAEYVVDDPSIAVGTGTPFTGAFGTPAVTGATAQLNLTTSNPPLTTGKHLVYVRAQDSAGNWGVVNSFVLTVSASGPVTTGGSLTPDRGNVTTGVVLRATGDDTLLGGSIDRAEYFLGAAGPDGTGTPLALTPASVAAESATIPAAALAGLPEGPVTVFVHSHDTFGLWGPAQNLTFTLDRTAPTLVSGVAEPSPNNGTAGSAVDSTAIKITGGFTDPPSGGVSSAITAAEGFVDNPGGTPGTGFVFVAADGAFDSTAETAYGLLPLSQLTGMADGLHQIYVHARDAAGNWGTAAPVPLVLDRGGPAVTAAAATPSTVVRTTTALTVTATATDALTAVTAAEWFEGTDPGKGLGRPMAVTGTGPLTASLRADVPPGGFGLGQHTLSLRARDAAGNWGPVTTVQFTVSQLSNTLFADGFESGTTRSWAASTGPVAVTPGAALSGGYGLQATAGGANPAYVTDPTPLNESAYHLQFQFRPDTLATGTGTVNLAAGMSGGGQQLFAVQYRKSAGTPQVRLGARRNTGAIAYTAWQNLTTGTNTLRVDWAAGTSVTESLTVGTAVQRLTGFTTGTVRLETLWLGLSGGGGGTTGAASFDAVLSTRFTLP
ncbi:multicopper oxidase domain-containing protein [Amycolatopsis sp. NPDC004625]|uniref:multicopper oxidase domain-containing protein n=1 Tax=Amycolatopsis sp. NPDC004625 TaxID=3154670 RepID=UPI0033B52406